MMKNYLLSLKSLAFLGVIMASAWNMAMGQCAIVGPSEGCQDEPITFTATGVNPGDQVDWTTNTAGAAVGGTASFTFPTPGAETITLKVTGPSGTCNKTLSFTVNAKPVGNFIHTTITPQCYTGNYFCFKDLSTAGVGRTFVGNAVEFLFGGSQTGLVTTPGGTYCESYPVQTGGDYQPFIRVTNDKGCKDDFAGPWIRVIPDLGVNFSTTAGTSCGQTVVPITNTSSIPYNRVKKYYWDFGDGETYTSGQKTPGIDSCYWNPTHVYTKHGCFDVMLIVEDDSNCKDTMFKKNFACNVNPNLVISTNDGKDAQCQTGNAFTFTHNIDPLHWPVNFLWVFDDPDSGPQNFNNQNFKGAPHSFTKPDVYTVTINGTIAGCPFNAAIDVLTKGPAATIEAKAIPDIIADTQRHQCQIKDTVYFKNNSKFAFNDQWILDDLAGATSLLEDGVHLLRWVDSVKKYETPLEIYVWDGDSCAVIAAPLTRAANNVYKKDTLIMFNNFFGVWGGERQDDHVVTVWEFSDQTAPQCTTWTRYKQNMFDANGKWMNCNWSRDPKPKHWYTPGEEACYTVMLKMQDTTYQKPLQGFQYYYVEAYHKTQKRYVQVDVVSDTTWFNTYWSKPIKDTTTLRYRPGGVWNDTARFVEYLRLDSLFTYPPSINPLTGDTLFVYSPYCAKEIIDTIPEIADSLKIFNGFDSIFGRWYINPNLRNGNSCEAQSTVLLALEPPLATGMKVRPFKGVFCLGSNPTYGVTFDWSDTKPGCTRQFVWMNFDSLLDRLDATPGVLDKWTPQQGFLLNPTTPWPLGTLNMPQWPNQIYYDYTGKIADSCGRITVGLRVQNGKDPYTGLPCIDEKWYHEMLRYVNSDPEFKLDTIYGCSPLEVEFTFNREYMDSLEALIINVNKDYPTQAPFDAFGSFYYVDSVFRNKYDPVSGDTVNYVVSYYVDENSSIFKIDSFTFLSGAGATALGCGSELKIKRKRKLTFHRPGRWAIGATANTVEGCANVAATQYVTVAFDKAAWADRTLICQGEQVNFYDTAMYLLEEMDPVTGAQHVAYNFWRDQNWMKYPDGSNRTPFPYRERTFYDFDRGIGFVPVPFNPATVSYYIPGHYTIRARFIDSVGCSDTVEMDLDVTGANANFNFTIAIGNCKPIINFFDSSRVYDPCKILRNVGCDSVIRWIWDFGDGSPIVNTTIDAPFPPIKNPSHVYQKFGDFDVKLVVETRMGCFDTLVRTVSVAGPMPKFDFTIDSMGCVPYTVYLGNFSLDPAPGAEWTFYFGDGNQLTTKEDTVVYHTYTNPGVYKVSLMQNDIVPLTGERCNASYPDSPAVFLVTVLPEKKVDFTISKREVCPNENITFTDTSDTTYSTFIWDFGDGNVLTLPEPQGRQVTHSYSQVGDYVVRLFPDYTPKPGEPKCRQSKSYLIKVRDVNANFSIDSSQMPFFKFKNLSTNAKDHWWRFGDGDNYTPCPVVDPVNCPDATHNYGDKQGTFDVCLVVLSPEGCYDTTCATVRNTFETSIKIPNVFTPNDDGTNDKFVVDIKGWSKYEIKIYNRFSEKVYQSTDPNDPWNGKKDNTGADLPAGVYYVVITYQLRGQTEQTYNGTVTLIRE